MSDSDIVLYAAYADELLNEDIYAAAYELATPQRRAKTDRYIRAEDRRLSLTAELLLRFALRQLGAELPTELCSGEHGKPYADGAPHFNISHSGEYALCAASRKLPVGCDIEAVAEADLALTRRCFTPDETAMLKAAQPGTERDTLFFRFWTLKESLMKVTGAGMSIPPNEIPVSTAGSVSDRLTFNGISYRFHEYSIPNDTPAPSTHRYRCALCVPADTDSVRLQYVSVCDILKTFKDEGMA